MYACPTYRVEGEKNEMLKLFMLAVRTVWTFSIDLIAFILHAFKDRGLCVKAWVGGEKLRYFSMICSHSPLFFIRFKELIKEKGLNFDPLGRTIYIYTHTLATSVSLHHHIIIDDMFFLSQVYLIGLITAFCL